MALRLSSVLCVSLLTQASSNLCLLQTSANVHKKTHDHNKKKHAGHKKAAHHKVKEGDHQAPLSEAEVQAYVTKANQTLETISAQFSATVDLVNSTTLQAVGFVSDGAQTCQTALDTVQSLAESTRMVIGDDVADNVVAVIAKLEAILPQIVDKIEQFQGKLDTTLVSATTKFEGESDTIVEKFQAVVDKLNAISASQSPANATSFLQESSHLPGWLASIFGGSPSPCDQAMSLIKQANGTVGTLLDEFVELNSTVVEDIFAGAVDTVNATLHDAKAKFDALLSAQTNLPAPAVTGIQTAATKLFTTLVGNVLPTVEGKQAEFTAQIAQMQTAAQALTSTVDDFLDQANALCAPATDDAANASDGAAAA